ncbi:MAG: hypothetical protein AAFR82_00630 [Pseudomonadota bacterium]
MRTLKLDFGETIEIPLSDVMTALLGLCLLAALAVAAHSKPVLLSDANMDPASPPPAQQVAHSP